MIKFFTIFFTMFLIQNNIALATPKNCGEILGANPSATSDIYTIDPDGDAPFFAYCDMQTGGGGWTAFFSGINGSANVFNHFEDTAADCTDPKTHCLRRIPDSMTVNDYFLATCGNSAVKFQVNSKTLNYFMNGRQGGNWEKNRNVVTISGGAKVKYATNIFTGNGSNKGWIIGDINPLSATFSSSYSLHGGFNYCNGVANATSPIHLYYRPLNATPAISSFTAMPQGGNPPLTVDFLVVAKDLDGSIAYYQWNYGDGNTDTTTTGNTSHTYSNLGTFNASVIVMDNKGTQSKVSSIIPITVQYAPDLFGKVKSYLYDDDTNTIRIDFNVTNAGDIAASQFSVTFNLSNDGRAVSSTFNTSTVNGLSPGASQTISVDYTSTDSLYGKYILILVDPNKSVAEVDETNNGARIVIQPMATGQTN